VPRTGTAFHGSIGTGFRAPSLAENLFPFGNPDLLPEKSIGWDCGLRQTFCCGRLEIDGTYFRNDFTNLIIWDPTPIPPDHPFGSLQNVGRSFSSGVELTAHYRVNPCTTITANYVHTFTEDLDTGLPLLRRPKHKAAVTLHRRFCCDRADLYVDLMYVGPRLDNTFAGPVDLEEYYLLNLAGSYRLGRCTQLYARLDNVLDEDYEEVWGYATPGLSFYGGLKMRF
jgi:vitamin B12 transporter